MQFCLENLQPVYFFQAKLLMAQYSQKCMNLGVDINLKNYEEAVNVFPSWEDSLVALGDFYSTLLELDNSYR